MDGTGRIAGGALLVVDDDELDRQACADDRPMRHCAGASHREAVDARERGDAAGRRRRRLRLRPARLRARAATTGSTCCATSAGTGKDVPVVVLTGHSRSELAAAALMKSGATEFLTKDLITPDASSRS